MNISHPQLDSINRIMDGFTYPWFIGGGWAIDLKVGKVTRNHGDMDICVFREHAKELLAHFSGWQIEVAIPKESRLEPVLSIEDIRPPRYGLHLTKNEEFVEVLLTDKQDGEIIFRRDGDIKMPIQEAIRTDPIGRKYIAPELQLLYKAKEERDKDHHDFSIALLFMDDRQKAWLLKALAKHHPDSPWISRLIHPSLK